MDSSSTRRGFLMTAGTAAASVVAGSVATGFPANETLNVGVIGSGGRARHLLKSFPKLDSVRLVAVCDVWDVALAEGKKLADPQAFTTKKYQVRFEGTFSNANKGAHAEFLGTEASLYVDRGRIELVPERNKKVEPFQEILANEPKFRGADFYDVPDGELLHLKNWVECVKSRKDPVDNVSAGIAAAAAAHLANQALRTGQTAVWKG